MKGPAHRGGVRGAGRLALALAMVFAFLSGTRAARRQSDDYVATTEPSAAARACFEAVPEGLDRISLVRGEAVQGAAGGACYEEDGSISIPPGAMLVFRNAGKCMDPHLPAPASGEPMQFVPADRLIPPRLRETYENLLARQAAGDPEVARNNLQHLVWAIRTAGTDDPFADNLSDSQRRLLDECFGRRNGFTKYHEREKARNARHSGRPRGDGRVSVGNLSYDARELAGTNAARRIESHVSTLLEMGEKSTVSSSADFRYGELEEELYSDVVCDGGLSFTAKILNVSGERKTFRATDFAAQVGNGAASGARRQRVTMNVPDRVEIVMGAAREVSGTPRRWSWTDIGGGFWNRMRQRRSESRTERELQGHVREDRQTETYRRERTETHTVTEEIPSIPSIPPVPPVPPVETVTNTVTNTAVTSVPEPLEVRVVALEYDAETQQGILTVEIVRGSFLRACDYIRKHAARLVSRNGHLNSGTPVPAGSRVEIVSIGIDDRDFLEVAFEAAP